MANALLKYNKAALSIVLSITLVFGFAPPIANATETQNSDTSAELASTSATETSAAPATNKDQEATSEAGQSTQASDTQSATEPDNTLASGASNTQNAAAQNVSVQEATQNSGTQASTTGESASTNNAATATETKPALPALTPVSLSTGNYSIKSSLNTSKVLDVKGGSTANAANVILYASNGGQHQKWNIAKVANKDKTYTIRSIKSGKYLAMDSNGNICQRNKNTDGTQYWTAAKIDGAYVFVNVKYKKVITVAGGSSANGTNIQGAAFDNSKSQKFSMSGTKLLDKATYVVRTKQVSSQAIDVKGGSFKSKANVQTYKWNKSGAQKFTFIINSDGTYTIVNAQSNKALEVKGGKAKSGANIWQNTKKSSKAQKWKIVDNGNGTFRLVSALNSSYALTVSGKPKNSANVYLTKDKKASNQSFKFEKTTYTLPKITGDTSLDRRVLSLAKDKKTLRACFNWVKKHKHTNWAGSRTYATGTYALTSKKWIKTETKRMLDGKKVDCYAYAASFAVLAKALGYDAKVVCGTVPRIGGGRAAHGWVEIKRNGKTLVYDPDLQRSHPSVNFYGFTYSKAPTNYRK